MRVYAWFIPLLPMMSIYLIGSRLYGQFSTMTIYTVFTFLKVLAKFKEWRGSHLLLGRTFKTQSTISLSCVNCGTRENEVMK